jgi:hypothetical protein
VVTVTSTVPAASAGLVTVIEVSLFTTRPVPAVAPKSTTVAPVKLVPVRVTLVAPASGPPLGLTPVTVGAEAAKTGATGDTTVIRPAGGGVSELV